MNTLLAGVDQVYDSGSWRKDLKTEFRDTGNAMDRKQALILSEQLPVETLRGYRDAVGRQTRKVIAEFDLDRLASKVDPAGITVLKRRGDVVPEAAELLSYWANRSHAELLLMPPTRHNLVHLNQASDLKRKLMKSKKRPSIG